MCKRSCFGVLGKLFLMIMFITCSVEFGYANSVEPTRYWLENGMKPKSSPLQVSASGAFRFDFSSDERLCKKKYGKDWSAICSRSVGDILPNTKDIRMDPPHPGSWKWVSSNSLHFYPSKTWPAGQEYTVYIGKKSLPKQTKLTGNPTFYTRALRSDVSGSFKFDPDQYKNMRLTGSIDFNYPVALDSAREHFSIEVIGDEKDSLLLGETELTMDASNRALYYSIPILQLPKKVVEMRVSMKSGYRPEFGGKLGSGDYNTNKIPSKGSMLQIEGIRVQLLDMPDLSLKQTINIELSLPALPKNLEKKMSVYLMPRQEIGSEVSEHAAPFEWWNLGEVDAELLKHAQKLKLTLLNDPETPTRFLSFAVEKPIDASRYIYLDIDKNLQGVEEYRLTNSKQAFIEMPSMHSYVKIMQTGAVLNLNGDQKISLYARNLDEIEYTIYQIRPEFLNMYVSNFGLRNNRYSENISLNELSIISRGTTKLAHKDSGKAQFTSLDLGLHLADKHDGIFFLSIKGNFENSTVARDSRFIMLTDIGLIRKKNDDASSQVYAVSLESGKPLSGVSIEVIGLNGIAIYEEKTSRDGMVRIPSLETYKHEKYPVAIVAKQRKDLAYIPYAKTENLTDISRSYTGGKQGIGDGIYGFIFNQRDIYKPGEMAHFGFILKQKDFDASTLSGIPLNVAIYDSRDKQVESKRIKLNANGFSDVSYLVPEQAITGRYRIAISMADGTNLLNGSFQVEEFEPDTLRLEAGFDLPPKKGWYLPSELKDLKVNATLMNLFGAPAVDHLITGEVKTQQGSFHFREYADWNFYDAARLDRSKDYTFIGVNSDEKGLASFSIPSPLFEKETSVLDVEMRGFNAAGSRSVMGRVRLATSPLEAVMGWKSKANLDYIPQDIKASLEIMAINSSLEPHAFGTFTMEYYSIDYVRSLVKNSRGEYVYRTERKETLVESKQLKLTEKSLKWNINTQKSGDKLLIAKDANKRIILRIPYTVAGESLSQFGEMNTADLRVKLSKAKYESDEDIEIYMQLPYDGAGLITIERENVVSHQWFRAKRGEHIEEMEVPEGIEGRAFLNVLYFRDSEDADIFTQPSANVVLPFIVNIKKRELALTLDVLDTGVKGDDILPVVRPGKNMKVKLSSKNPSKVILYAVDEGILQMTGYRTPNPIYDLLVDRALEVSTYQYFDLLMPEYGVLAKYIAKFGGDVALEAMAKNANPFRRKGIKSVAFWSGLVDVDSKGSIVEIPLPSTFNGQLRLIAVGASESKVNVIEKRVLARSEVVIQPSVPYFVAPGDEFLASLTLTDTAKIGAEKRTWKLSVKAGEGLELVDNQDMDIELDPQKQQTLTLRFKVRTPYQMLSEKNVVKLLGNQDIHFTLSNGKDTVQMPVSLSVRPAVGLQNESHLGQLVEQGVMEKAGKVLGKLLGNEEKDSLRYEKALGLSNTFYPQLSKFSASMSPVPKAIVQGLVEELRSRRYRSTSMRLSEDFALLAIMQNPQFTLKGEAYSYKVMSDEIAWAIQNLASHYSNDLHFTLWPSGYGRSSLRENVYFADFLVEAKGMEISLPYGLESNFLKALEERISRMPRNMNEARSIAYGAWVLTQNGVVTSNVMANLVSWLDKNNRNWKKDIIAPLMAASMDIMLEEKMANRLLSRYSPDPKAPWSWYADFDGLAERALYVSIIAKQFPEHLNVDKTTTIVNEMVSLISNGYYGDMSAALAARSLVFYSVAQEKKADRISWNMEILADNKKLLLSGNGGNSEIPAKTSGKTPGKTSGEIPKIPSGTPFEASLESAEGMLVSKMKSVKMDSNTPLYYNINFSGYPVEIPTTSTNSELELFREYRDLDGNILSEFAVGEEVIVAIRARIRSESSHDIVITDLLPASFEIILAEDGKITQVSTEEGRAMSSIHKGRAEADMRTLYVDRREDRMIIYATLNNNETVFRYRVRVAHKGNFIIPPIIGKGLKDPTMQALTVMEFGSNKGTMSVE